MAVCGGSSQSEICIAPARTERSAFWINANKLGKWQSSLPITAATTIAATVMAESRAAVKLLLGTNIKTHLEDQPAKICQRIDTATMFQHNCKLLNILDQQIKARRPEIDSSARL